MPDVFMDLMAPILKAEGGYSDHPLDKGGPTRYGITQARARASGYQGDMRVLPLDVATQIYRTLYWKQPMFDQIEPIDPQLSGYMLSLGINMGPYWPSMFTQRALNALNRNASDYPDIDTDGVFGVMSRDALSRFITVRKMGKGDDVLLFMVHAQASVRYLDICEANPSQEAFEFGWQHWRAMP